jgi:hypothetical protein
MKTTTTEKDENCNYEAIAEYIYIVGGKVVYSITERNTYYGNHNSEYTYKMFGATCEDGYEVSELCKDCGYTNSWTNYSHNTTYSDINLGALGLCGGSIDEYRCLVCNTVTEFLVFDYDCNWELQDTDAEGYSVYKCDWCSAVKKYKYTYTEKDENCNQTRTEEYIFILNGNVVYNAKEVSNYSEHDFENTYEMFEKTCYDGYKVICTCKDCGYTESWNSYGHDSEWEYIYLGDFGICGGYIEEGRCQACDTVTKIDYAFDCYDLTWLDVDADGYSVHKCNDCNAIFMIKSDEKGEYLIIQKDGKEIYNGSRIY